jgi:hypothetical protein
MTKQKEKHPMTAYLSSYGESSATINGYIVQIKHDGYAENPRADRDTSGEATRTGGGNKEYGTLMFFNSPYGHRHDYTHLSDKGAPTRTRNNYTRFDLLASIDNYNQYEEDEKMEQEMPEEWHWMLMLARLHAKYAVVGVDMRDYGGGNMRIYTSTPTTQEEWEDTSTDGLIYKYVGDKPEQLEAAGKQLEAEINEFEHWITGNTWGFTIEKDGGDIDSCWGFYGDHDESGLFDHIMYTVAPLTTTDSEENTGNEQTTTTLTPNNLTR